MKKYNIKPEDIKIIELSLINKCNLKCPLCLRQQETEKLKRLKNKWGEFYIPLDILKSFLEKLPNLEKVVLMGSVSEPTLYPDFFDLIKYLKSKKLKIRLSTNGSTHNNDWWNNLGKLLDKNDIVRFPLDGSTQELHSKYRVGSSLEKVLEHHKSFKENSKAITICQFIEFQYNTNDYKNVEELAYKHNFDIFELSPSYKPFSFNRKDGVLPTEDLLKYQKKYERLLKNKLLNKPVNSCPEMDYYAIYLSHMGFVVPCNELEDKYLFEDITLPLIDQDLNLIFDNLNRILNNRDKIDICIDSCNPLTAKECFKYPIKQLNLKSNDNNFYDLKDFRECILNS